MNMANWDVTMTKLIEAHVFPQVLFRALLFGISRAGKSTLGQKLFPNNWERIACNRDMTTDDMIGGMSLVNGSTKWLDGPAVRALRQGKALILDEVNYVSPECRPYLHAIMDDPPAITLPTGERVNAAPGYCVLGTTNELPSELPLPIYDRFDVVLKVLELSDGLVKSLGRFATPAKNAAHKQAKKYSTWTRPASINMWLAASKLQSCGVNDEQIADYLGLHDQERADFLIAIAPSRGEK
jgi:MoxR-like ATPase